MIQALRADAQRIIQRSIEGVLPDQAVCRAIQGRKFGGKIILVSAGKAAWQMAKAACGCLGDQIETGVVITKYGHVQGPVGNLLCCEGGHPIPDENAFQGTQAALERVQGLDKRDTVLFLLSGGGSALFEKPLISPRELQDITEQLLCCGADIVEMNTVRKRLSAVKGGRFAQLCAPARVFSVILSDVLGNQPDRIASGPAVPDPSTCAQAEAVVDKYHLRVSGKVKELLAQETPKGLDNVETHVTGSVQELCRMAADACADLGYEPFLLTDQMRCQAREAGSFLASVAKSHSRSKCNLAFLAGGETVVKLTGGGKGGRNQELALAAAEGICGIKNALIFSVGSDGTDGPTDAAGGMVDGRTADILRQKGISIHKVLEENDSYHALKCTDGLIFTGPTGTNVNDISVVLIKGLGESNPR